MAKLSDITLWIERMLHGDAPRARSLIQLGRKAGLFATGGRGPGAPDMGPRDAGFATLLALYDGPPTACGPAVTALAALPLSLAEVFPNGPRGGDRLRLTGDSALRQQIPVPGCFASCPATVIDALSGIFNSESRPYHLDSITIRSGPAGQAVFIRLFDLDIEIQNIGESERDFFQFDMEFRAVSLSGDPPNPGRTSEFSFSGEELSDLYCLICGLDPEEDI